MSVEEMENFTPREKLCSEMMSFLLFTRYPDDQQKARDTIVELFGQDTVAVVVKAIKDS